MNAGWKQRREGGGHFALWLIRSIGLYGGRPLARACLYPITLYFLLRRGAERRDSRAWLGRALGRPATLLDVARHVHTFAATTLDRIFLLAGRMSLFDVRVSGLQALHAQLDQERGVLLYGAHLGSFEVLRVLARQRPEYRVCIVLDKAHNPELTRLLDALDPQMAANVIDASQDGPSLMLAIKQAADEGALVALLADRSHPGAPNRTARFFGAPAAFPVAPWLIAAALKMPVSLGFGLYRGGNRYDLVFESFDDDGIDLPRAQRAAQLGALIQRYAARLEDHARDAPCNWFNFYDFWNTNEDTPDMPDAAGTDDGPAVRGAGLRSRAAGG